MTGLTADFKLDWGDDEAMLRVKEVQDRICSSPQPINALAYPGEECSPYECSPYVAHIYIKGGYEKCFVGTIVHEERWPTANEITNALQEWRSDIKFDAWWVIDPEATLGPHCITCICK